MKLKNFLLSLLVLLTLATVSAPPAAAGIFKLHGCTEGDIGTDGPHASASCSFNWMGIEHVYGVDSRCVIGLPPDVDCTVNE